MSMTQKVLKVGSSAAVNIPKGSLKELGLAIGDQVNVIVDKKSKRMVIEAVSGDDIDREVVDWTDSFIRRYRPAPDALSKK